MAVTPSIPARPRCPPPFISSRQKRMACSGKPAQCLIRRKRSSSTPATNRPSTTAAAEASAWKAERPRIRLSATAEGTLGLLPADDLSPAAGTVDPPPLAPLGGAVQLEAAVHVAAGAGLVEAAGPEARPQPRRALAAPEVEEALLQHVAHPQVGDGVHGGDATAGHHRTVREDDGAVVELHA